MCNKQIDHLFLMEDHLECKRVNVSADSKNPTLLGLGHLVKMLTCYLFFYTVSNSKNKHKDKLICFGLVKI